jgi:hypothetical protein
MPANEQKLPEELPPGVRPIGDDMVWEPWHPRQLAEMFAAVTVPWYVAAGWALDLFRGEQTREHEDLEVAIPSTAEAFAQVRAALAGYELEVPVGPEPGHLWPLDSAAFETRHQTWVSEIIRDAHGQQRRVFRLDVFREPQRDGQWVCRRDESMTLPYDDIIRHDADGIPYLAPQFVLLFKAKHVRPKDQADFDGVLPLLTPAECNWLADTIDRIHPGHDWPGQLRAGEAGLAPGKAGAQ